MAESFKRMKLKEEEQGRRRGFRKSKFCLLTHATSKFKGARKGGRGG
jgi:hypothetical protein